MKVLLSLLSFCIMATSFAKEVETDCLAMSENREKTVKTVTVKSKTSATKSSSLQ